MYNLQMMHVQPTSTGTLEAVWEIKDIWICKNKICSTAQESIKNYEAQKMYLEICNSNDKVDMSYWRALTDCQEKDKWPNF